MICYSVNWLIRYFFPFVSSLVSSIVLIVKWCVSLEWIHLPSHTLYIPYWSRCHIPHIFPPIRTPFPLPSILTRDLLPLTWLTYESPPLNICNIRSFELPESINNHIVCSQWKLHPIILFLHQFVINQLNHVDLSLFLSLSPSLNSQFETKFFSFPSNHTFYFVAQVERFLIGISHLVLN